MLTKLFNSVYRWFNPKTTQEVFDIVIDSGYYANCSILNPDKSYFMCVALRLAYDDKLVTNKERCATLTQIDAYITSTTSHVLKTYLIERNLPYAFNDRLAIYRDWANRP